MEARLVIGLFRSSGIAEDACNRLKTEGIPSSRIARRVLGAIAPVLPSAAPELDALAADTLILGNVRESLTGFVHNGETAVFVRTVTDREVEFVVDTLRQYPPITINVLPLSVEAVLRSSPGGRNDAG